MRDFDFVGPANSKKGITYLVMPLYFSVEIAVCYSGCARAIDKGAHLADELVAVHDAAKDNLYCFFRKP